MAIRNPVDRDIAALAIPALGALVVEPLFLLADTAMVGHLGNTALAALAIAGTLLQTIVGVMILLAYATTPAVARRVGAGDIAGAISAGISGIWLALGLGVLLLAVGILTTPWLVSLFTTDTAVTVQARSYLTASLWGIPAMLVVLAGTGILRGLQDTKTTLIVAAAGFGANIVLNAVLIYGARLGVAGSGLGTALAQWGMALAYLIIIGRHARAAGARRTPDLHDIGGTASSSWWLFLRTVSLRICVVATVWVAARIGPTETANYQIVSTLFTTCAFALDALAIAAQALIGKVRGEGNPSQLHELVRRLIWWGWIAGAALGVLFAAVSPVLGFVFTSDAAVLTTLPLTILLMAVGLPLAGFVFILDGIMIGAEDNRYLAGAMGATVLVHVGALALVFASGWTGLGGALALWFAYGFVFLGTRAATLAPRVGRLFGRTKSL